MLELSIDNIGSVILGVVAGLFLAILASWPARLTFRAIIASLGIGAYCIAAILYSLQGLNVFSLLFAWISLYQVINLVRICLGRVSHQHIKQLSFESALYLSLFQLATVLADGVYSYWAIDSSLAITKLAILSLVWAVASTYLIYLWLKRTAPKKPVKSNQNIKQPTLSLLIPARNEDQDLEDCINQALLSNYPKLEIIVLDDCSSDRTPELIRAYAQKGVRFINGETPTKGWLAKNQAYNKLATEASGEILMFSGVDTRLQTHAVSDAVNLMQSTGIEMISIMPKRGGQNLYGVLVQPMRYWLEFVGSGLFAKRPPVLSTCWLITSHSYKKLGGLKAVRNSILPEAYFAKSLALKHQYAFLRSAPNSGIITLKSLSDQIDTAVRVRYPSLKKRPELVWLLSASYLAFMVLPFIGLIAGVGGYGSAVWLLCLISAILYSIGHITINAYSNPSSWWLSVLSFPIVVSFEVVLMNCSMLKYEFGEVRWKGRNICLPVMDVQPRLPKF